MYPVEFHLRPWAIAVILVVLVVLALPGSVPIALRVRRRGRTHIRVAFAGGLLAGTLVVWASWWVGQNLLAYLILGDFPPWLAVLGYLPAWALAWWMRPRPAAREAGPSQAEEVD